VRGGIRFTSELPVSRHAELDRLLYFNDNQHKVDRPLREALRRYGSPSMVLGERLIRFSVPHVPSVQTLYAMDESGGAARLAAVSIYTREDRETLSVLFLAVHEDYAHGGADDGKQLAQHLLEVLRESAARTKGILWLRLSYHPKDLRIPVRKPGEEALTQRGARP
jgi:hypothetical protein